MNSSMAALIAAACGLMTGCMTYPSLDRLELGKSATLHANVSDIRSVATLVGTKNPAHETKFRSLKLEVSLGADRRLFDLPNDMVRTNWMKGFGYQATYVLLEQSHDKQSAGLPEAAEGNAIHIGRLHKGDVLTLRLIGNVPQDCNLFLIYSDRSLKSGPALSVE